MPARKECFSPVLKEGAIWYVEWYAEVKGKRSRIRVSETDDGAELNSIADLRERRRVAEEWIFKLRKRLKPPVNDPARTVFVEALMSAVRLKSSPKKNTMDTYESNARWLCDFFKLRGWDGMLCEQVRFDHVQAYFDHLILTKKVSNTTHNSRKNNLRALFTELVQRRFLPENYLSKIAYRKEVDTIRRPMSEEEEQVLLRAIAGDRAMLFAYIVQRYLGVRPDETRHLRCGQFRLDEGMLVFPAADGKNGRNNVVTIPDGVVPALRRMDLHRWPATHFVLGTNKLRDNPTFLPRPEMIGENTLSEKFRQTFRRLHREGKLRDITGLTFYSLKDTLAVYMLDNAIDLKSAMEHFRQRDLESFQRYAKRLGVVNEKIRGLPVLFELPD